MHDSCVPAGTKVIQIASCHQHCLCDVILVTVGDAIVLERHGMSRTIGSIVRDVVIIGMTFSGDKHCS